jgi:predicted lipid-binding transport protein (Tim44 family)
MKRVLGLTVVLSVVLMGTLMAQAGATPAGQAPMTKTTIMSPADYSTVMKEVGSTNGMLGKAIQSSSAADAAKASARLETLFKDVQAYWAGKKVDDATNFAGNAVAAAQAISKAVAANDMAAATEARTKLASQCMGCHTAHREKTDAGFIMK